MIILSKFPHIQWKFFLLITALCLSTITRVQAMPGGTSKTAPAQAVLGLWSNFQTLAATGADVQTVKKVSVTQLDASNMAYLLNCLQSDDQQLIMTYVANERPNAFLNKVKRHIPKYDESGGGIDWEALWSIATGEDEPMSDDDDPDDQPPRLVSSSRSDDEGDSDMDSNSSSHTSPPPRGNCTSRHHHSPVIHQHQHYHQTGVLPSTTPAVLLATAGAGAKAGKRAKPKHVQTRSYLTLPETDITLEEPKYVENDVDRKGQIGDLVGALADVFTKFDPLGRQIASTMHRETIQSLIGVNIASLVDLTTTATGFDLLSMVPVFTLYNPKTPFSSLQRQLKEFLRILTSSPEFNIIGEHRNSLIPLLLIQQGRIQQEKGLHNVNMKPLDYIIRKFPSDDNNELWTFTYELLNQLNLRPKLVNLPAQFRSAENALSSLGGMSKIRIENPDALAKIIAENVKQRPRGRTIDPKRIQGAKYNDLIRSLEDANVSCPHLEVAIAMFSLTSPATMPEDSSEWSQDQLKDLDQFASTPPEEDYRQKFSSAILKVSDHRQIEALVKVFLRCSYFLSPELMQAYEQTHLGSGSRSGTAYQGYVHDDEVYETAMDVAPPAATARPSQKRQPVDQRYTPAKASAYLSSNDTNRIWMQLKDELSEWTMLANTMSIPYPDIRGLEIQYMHRQDQFQMAIINKWLQQGPKTWEDLAIHLEQIDMNMLAYNIRAYASKQSEKKPRDSSVYFLTPSLLEITNLRDSFNLPVRIIEGIAAGDYSTFGMFLLEDDNGMEVNLITKNHIHHGAEFITTSIIKSWLNKTGNKKTWMHLMECIQSAGQGALAERMKPAIPLIYNR